MPNIFEEAGRRGQRMPGDVYDHDEYDYRATRERARTEDPRQRYVPTLDMETPDALLEVSSIRR
jgi:hypothetical protein